MRRLRSLSATAPVRAPFSLGGSSGTKLLALAGVAVMAAACSRAEEKPAAAPAAPAAEAAAPSPAGAVAATELPADVSAAMDQLQGRLKERLVAEIAKGGPVAAADICRTEAAAITAELQKTGLKIGRTSHALRNPANAAPAWAEAWVKAQGGRKVAAGPKLAAADLPGGGKGYLRAIGTAPVCLTCHGPADQLVPPLREVLAKAYPQDRATGFAENDVRGWFWAEKLP